jgi:hypothetical protein
MGKRGMKQALYEYPSNSHYAEIVIFSIFQVGKLRHNETSDLPRGELLVEIPVQPVNASRGSCSCSVWSRARYTVGVPLRLTATLCHLGRRRGPRGSRLRGL